MEARVLFAISIGRSKVNLVGNTDCAIVIRVTENPRKNFFSVITVITSLVEYLLLLEVYMNKNCNRKVYIKCDFQFLRYFLR